MSEWMEKPQSARTNCPPGLEYLTAVDRLFVEQEVALEEVFTGIEAENQYVVKNGDGQKIYCVAEKSNVCLRNCCGHFRPCEMKVFDRFGNNVLNVDRPFACDCCCCPCFLQGIKVTAPPHTLLGTVKQKWHMLYPKFHVKSPSGEIVLCIQGPFCTSSCCCRHVDFNVFAADGKRRVGRVSKHWSGLLQETFTDADNFGITFPMDLDVRMKATVLGACLLIDMMYFEGNKTRNIALAVSIL